MRRHLCCQHYSLYRVIVIMIHIKDILFLTISEMLRLFELPVGTMHMAEY